MNEKKERARMILATKYDVYSDCYLGIGEYQMDNSLALTLYSESEGPIVRITAWIPARMSPEAVAFGKNAAFVDTNNFPQAMDFTKKYRLGKDTGLAAQNGYCLYPLIVFDPEALKMFVKEDT